MEGNETEREYGDPTEQRAGENREQEQRGHDRGGEQHGTTIEAENARRAEAERVQRENPNSFAGRGREEGGDERAATAAGEQDLERLARLETARGAGTACGGRPSRAFSRRDWRDRAFVVLSGAKDLHVPLPRPPAGP